MKLKRIRNKEPHLNFKQMDRWRKTLCLSVTFCAATIPTWAQSSFQELYFKTGWTQVTPKTTPLIFPNAVPLGNNDPILEDAHYKIVHRSITKTAYEMYAAQFGSGEFAKYIDQVIAGSYDEDISRNDPFDQEIPQLRHFWDCRKGPYHGLFGHDSAVDRAYKYFTGGYGFGGKYDHEWSRKGVRGQGIIALYREGKKTEAYWYLGHAAHLLEDITVPAHVLLLPHPRSWRNVKTLRIQLGEDRYEAYIGDGEYKNWLTPPSMPIESFSSLYDLYYKTASITDNFDAGYGPGRLQGKNGTVDQGKRRKDRFTQKDLKQEANVLMPLAIKRVAALFLYFNRQVSANNASMDHTRPIPQILFDSI